MSPLDRQGHVTEGGLSTSPKAEATWDGVTVGCWSRAEAAGGMLGGYQLDTMGPCSVRSK